MQASSLRHHRQSWKRLYGLAVDKKADLINHYFLRSLQGGRPLQGCSFIVCESCACLFVFLEWYIHIASDRTHNIILVRCAAVAVIRPRVSCACHMYTGAKKNPKVAFNCNHGVWHKRQVVVISATASCWSALLDEAWCAASSGIMHQV